MKKFDIPSHYTSGLIGRLKKARETSDPRKKDFSPAVLDFGPVRFVLARHFGFCFGVENAIEISYRALTENPDKRIFLLSQMIHNQHVNEDLERNGIRSILDTSGNQLIPWDEITSDDVMIVPAFGTTLEIEALLEKKGVSIQAYNTTCPFVERVWKKSSKLGADDYTVVVHGKPEHEETRATFSHSKLHAPTLVVRNMNEAKTLAKYISGELLTSDFDTDFAGRYSANFHPDKHLSRIGVVNQTTMLASDTQAIAEYLKGTMLENFGEENSANHFADTRDTLCYATNDNQSATRELLDVPADLAIVVGGYNSSNTSHLVELLATKFPTYFVNAESEIESKDKIWHFVYPSKTRLATDEFLPKKEHTTIVLTSGASCPDTLIDSVLLKLLSFFPNTATPDEVLERAIAVNS